MEKQYVYDIGQYPPKGYCCPSYLKFKEKTAELTEKYFRNDEKSKKCDELKDNYCYFDKISFFEEFMQSVQVLNVIHIAWLMYPQIVSWHTVDPGLTSKIFRHYNSPIKVFLNTLLKDPSKRGKIHWCIEVLLRYCPFLFLAHQQEYHLESLIRMLLGKKISRAAEDVLYFAINGRDYPEAEIVPLYHKVAFNFYDDIEFTDNEDDDENLGDNNDGESDYDI